MKEKAVHINRQELLAVYNSLRCFKMYFQTINVKIFSDSQVRVQITAAHIPGAENVIGDYESRKRYKHTEWMLNPALFQKAIKHLPYKPDIYAYLTDAFFSSLGMIQLLFIVSFLV